MDTGLNWAERQVRMLEDYRARRGAYTEPNYQWNFKVATSCPPSTVIHMRGGRIWGDPDSNWDGQSWYVESASYDLADFDDTGYSYTFTNAYYYKPLAVMLRWSGSPDAAIPQPLYILTSAEQATAAEAEEAAYPAIITGAFDPDLWYGISLGIFIVRNNGNIALPNQFLPIDAVNRGRSYLWRNAKLRYLW